LRNSEVRLSDIYRTLQADLRRPIIEMFRVDETANGFRLISGQFHSDLIQR
jgi:hypothetical protein